MTDRSEPKIKNRPFERLNLDIFGTLSKIFAKFLGKFHQILVDFSQILNDSYQNLVKVFENRDPLRKRFSILVIFGTKLWICNPLRDFLGMKKGTLMSSTYPWPVLSAPPEILLDFLLCTSSATYATYVCNTRRNSMKINGWKITMTVNCHYNNQSRQFGTALQKKWTKTSKYQEEKKSLLIPEDSVKFQYFIEGKNVINQNHIKQLGCRHQFLIKSDWSLKPFMARASSKKHQENFREICQDLSLEIS